MSIYHLGAWGQTIFALCAPSGISDALLELRQREKKIVLGRAEICAIAALAEAMNIDYTEYVPVLKRKLEES